MFYRFFSIERFQGWVEKLNLPLQLVNRSIGFNVGRTVIETITAIFNDRLEGVEIPVTSAILAIIWTAIGEVSGANSENGVACG